MLFERCPKSGDRFRNVLELRTARTTNWESLREKVSNFVHVRYEDLRNHPQLILHEISNKFGIAMQKQFRAVSSYKGKNKTAYTPKKYQAICLEDIEYILSNLDLPLENSIGYNVEKRKLEAHMEWLESQLEKKEQYIAEQDAFLKAIITGNSFKIGRSITWPIRKFRRQGTDNRIVLFSQDHSTDHK